MKKIILLMIVVLTASLSFAETIIFENGDIDVHFSGNVSVEAKEIYIKYYP